MSYYSVSFPHALGGSNRLLSCVPCSESQVKITPFQYLQYSREFIHLCSNGIAVSLAHGWVGVLVRLYAGTQGTEGE